MLTQRKEAILKALVWEYINTATPVASDTIVKKHGLVVSPATVRNEMSALEEEGYIARPYTSAGAVPVDKGYRFYVESLPAADPLPQSLQKAATEELNRAKKDLESWTSTATMLLAKLVQNLAISSFPRTSEPKIRHLELVYLQEFLALLVLVLQEAKVSKQLVPLKDPIRPEEMLQVSNKLNSHLSGLSHREIETKQLPLSPFEVEVLDAILKILEEEELNLYRSLYVEGLRHLLSQPEFAGSEKTQELVKMLEERSFVETILLQIPSGGGVVKVVIGEENPIGALHSFSIVLCQYGIPEEATGIISVLGPTRMEYRRTISSVQFVSSLMSNFIEEIYGRSP